jgi:hypothetical protein
LSAFSALSGAGAHLRPIGEFDGDVLEAEILVDRAQEIAEGDAFFRHLILGAEDVRVVLGEGAHAHDAVQGARGLVAVAGAELRHAQGQVAIALQPLAEDLHMAGAVHRLDRQHPVLDLGREHVLAELLPMAGRFP